MREEVNRILKLVEDGKLTGDQASAMIDALDSAERRSRRSETRHQGRERRHRHRHGGGRAFGGLLDELGLDIGRAVEDALRGVRDAGGLAYAFGGAAGADWVDDTNSATLAKAEQPTGDDYKVEGNRLVVSELKNLDLKQAEFCDNTMHAAALHDVEVVNGPLCRNTLRGASLKRASLTASDVTGNTLNGASLNRIALTSSVFKDNSVNGAHVRELDMSSAEIRSTKIAGSKVKAVTLGDGTKLSKVKIKGVVGERWKLVASTLSGVKFAALTDEAMRVRDLDFERVSLTGCDFVGCTFDGTTIRDVDAENLRFLGVDFTGMTIDSAERLKALATTADAA